MFLLVMQLVSGVAIVAGLVFLVQGVRRLHRMDVELQQLNGARPSPLISLNKEERERLAAQAGIPVPSVWLRAPMILGPGMTITGSDLTELERDRKAFSHEEPEGPHCPVCWGQGAKQLISRRHVPGTVGRYDDVWCGDQWHLDYAEAHRTRRRPGKVV